MATKIELQADTGITLTPTAGATSLKIATSGEFVRTDLLASAGGPNLIGFDREMAYEADTAGEAVSLALDSVREVVSLPGHISVTLINDDTQIQLGLPQPIRTSDNVTFTRITALEKVVSPGGFEGPTAPDAEEGFLGRLYVKPPAAAPTFTPLNAVTGSVSGRGSLYVVSITVNSAGFAVNGPICEIGIPAGSTPRPLPTLLVIPGNRLAWIAQGGNQQVFINPSNTVHSTASASLTFQLHIGANALTASQTYVFAVMVNWLQ